jgi:hypothetical protein
VEKSKYHDFPLIALFSTVSAPKSGVRLWDFPPAAISKYFSSIPSPLLFETARSHFIWKPYGIRAFQIEELLRNILFLQIIFRVAGDALFW